MRKLILMVVVVWVALVGLVCLCYSAAPTNAPAPKLVAVMVTSNGVPAQPVNSAFVLATNKGDLIVGQGTNVSRESVGTDNYVLTADSSKSNGVAWKAAGSGTATSVGLSAPASTFTVSGTPVTTSGTLALALANQATNAFFTGGNGGGVPTWRALIPADIPSAIPATRIGGGTVNDTEYAYLDGLTGGIQTNIDARVANTNGSMWGTFDLYSAGTEDGVTMYVDDAGETLYLKDMYGDTILLGSAATGLLLVPTYDTQVKSIYANGGRMTNMFMHFPLYMTNETTMPKGLMLDTDDGELRWHVGDTGDFLMRISPGETNVKVDAALQLTGLATNRVLVTQPNTATVTNSPVTATELGYLSGVTGPLVNNTSYEQNGGGTDYAIAGTTYARIDFSGNDPQVTITNTGTFFYIYTVSADSGASGAGDQWYSKVYNSTDASDVTDSEAHLEASGTNVHFTFKQHGIVTISSAPKTLQLYIRNATAARGTVEAAHTKITVIRLQ